MIDIEKWKNRIENELTLSKDLCLKEMRLNFTRNDLIELNVLLGSVSEIRNKVIEEFAERLKNKLVARYGNAKPTQQYMAMQVIDWCNEIAESMKGEKE